MEEAISTISVAGDILNDLRKITTGKDDFRRIDNIEQAAGNYKNDMQGFLKEYQKKNLADAAVLNGFRADMDENAAIYPHAIIIKADKSIIRDTA